MRAETEYGAEQLPHVNLALLLGFIYNDFFLKASDQYLYVYTMVTTLVLTRNIL